MELKDLVGEAVLGIVPMTDIRHPFDADASGVMFSIDQTTYLVFEDPNDGYRSAAGPLLHFAGDAYQLGTPNSQYIREPVLISHRTRGEYSGEDDVIEMRSKSTGQLIFEVGTTNVDDYYPSFHCAWHPEGLAANTPS